jgi:hypothetical protein
MNPIRDDERDQPRILGRVLAQETTMQELEAAHGGETAFPTWTLTYPPDRDKVHP